MTATDKPSDHAGPGLDDPLTDALVRTRRFFTKGDGLRRPAHPDQVGGRQADDFYRDRWSHDKVVRSTHGVNCTGSCSWKVYVKDGIITWETQQTDYPSVGPDSPEYEPRGCPRGAAFSWYTYSPTRVRYPYVRGVLLRDVPRGQVPARRRPGAGVGAHRRDPLRAKAYKSARGKGGLVRATWDEAAEIVAAAHVHTIKKYGPDRVAGFSPIPAMSMVSHASGARFVNLIGGSMLSFYDWYADLPVASPQVFGDQTDVPESGDWWNAGYLIMWGSNLPVTRTPDAHWMTEARYRGQKVVAVAPDYADNVKFADEWLPAKPGTDGALAMAMGHVVLKEFFVDRQIALLHRLRQDATPTCRTWSASRSDGRPRRTPPGKFLTAADLAEHADGRTPRSRPFCSTRERATRGAERLPGPSVRRRGRGQWNLDLGDSTPSSRCSTAAEESVVVRLPRFDTPDGARRRPASRRADATYRRPPRHHRLRPAPRPVRRRAVAGLPGEWAQGYDDADSPYTPAWQEAITGVPALDGGADRSRVRGERRGVPRPLDDRDGRRHQPLVPLRHDLPRVPDPDQPHRLPGRERRRLGPLRRAGEGPADHRLHPARQRARTGAARHAT